MSAPLPKVTVCVITYNHERYISQALDSVLMQKVDFPMEIAVSDDASTDATQRIAASYAERHPGRFRLGLRTVNVGPARNSFDAVTEARGEYMAVLEGDDFWIAPDKLARQVAFMDANPAYSICCHNVLVVGEGLEPRLKCPADWYATQEGVFQLEQLFSTNLIATGSTVYRRSALPPRLPDWWLDFCLHTGIGDWTLNVLAAERGPVRFFQEPMSAWRVHSAGWWSRENPTRKAELLVETQEVFKAMYGKRYAAHILPALGLRKMELAGFYAAGGRTKDAVRTVLGGLADLAASPGRRRLAKNALVTFAQPIDPVTSPPLPRFLKGAVKNLMAMNRLARDLVS